MQGLPELTIKHVLVIFHSQSGRSETLALAVYQGAQSEPEVQVRLRRAIDADSDDILWADVLVIVSPENFGAPSGGLKDFFDRAYYPLERAQYSGLPYALIISAGNDGGGCEQQLGRILKGLQARKIQETLIVFGRPVASDVEKAAGVGAAVAAGVALGIF